MFRVYPVCIDVARPVRPPADHIARFDSGHARQSRNSVTALAFNLAERSGSRAGRRRNAHDTALGERRETLANIEVAEAMG